MAIHSPHWVRYALLGICGLMITHESQAAFSLFDDFESLTLGNINGQSGWTSSGSGGNVALDPTNPENLVLSITTTGANVFKNFGALAILNSSSAATLFFRMYRADADVNISMGTSHNSTPGTSSFDEFRTQLNSNKADRGLNVRDAGGFKVVDTLDSGNWYSVWMVIDNSKDLYSVYMQGGVYEEPTLLDAGTETLFTFRTTGGDTVDGNSSPKAEDLLSFFAKTATSNTNTPPDTAHIGPVYLDDIYIDTTGATVISPVPEPASAGLVALGAVALIGRRRRS